MTAFRLDESISPVHRQPAREDSDYFYNLRGILIILVVLGHVLELFYQGSDAARFLYKEIYFFHMPMFIILAGYFSSNSVRIMNLVQSLVYPFVIMQLVYAVSDHVLFGADFLDSLVHPNWGMWFLICLFVWRAIWPYICDLPHLLTLSTLLAIACGYADNFDGTMSRLIVFFPFFVVGYRWAEKGGRAKALEWLRSYGPILLFAGILAQGIFLWGDFAPAWLYGKLNYSTLGEPHWWAGGVRLVVLLTAGIGILFSIVIAPIKANWITHVGKCSLGIYLVHFMFIDLLHAFDVSTKISSALNDHWAIVFVIPPLLAMAAVAFLSLPVIQTLSGYIYKPHDHWGLGR